jgi:hypothetical protein
MEIRKTGKLRTNYEKNKESEKEKGNWRKCKEASSHVVFVEKEERQEEILRIILLQERRHIVISYMFGKPKQFVLASHVTRYEGPCHFTPGRTAPRVHVPTNALVTVMNTEKYIAAGN